MVTDEYLARAYRGVDRRFPLSLLREFDLFSRKVLSIGWRRSSPRQQQFGVEETRSAFLKRVTGVRARSTVDVLFDRLAARAAFHARNSVAESKYLIRCLRTRSRTFDRPSAYEALVEALLATKRRAAAKRYCYAGLRFTRGRNEYAHAALRALATKLGGRAS